MKLKHSLLPVLAAFVFNAGCAVQSKTANTEKKIPGTIKSITTDPNDKTKNRLFFEVKGDSFGKDTHIIGVDLSPHLKNTCNGATVKWNKKDEITALNFAGNFSAGKKDSAATKMTSACVFYKGPKKAP